MIEVIQKNCLEYFLAELNETKSAYLISPFVTRNIVDHLLNNGSANIKLITRFNLNDFRSKVSSLSALKILVEKGAEIKGIKNLHSKVYSIAFSVQVCDLLYLELMCGIPLVLIFF